MTIELQLPELSTTQYVIGGVIAYLILCYFVISPPLTRKYAKSETDRWTYTKGKIVGITRFEVFIMWLFSPLWVPLWISWIAILKPLSNLVFKLITPPEVR